MKANKKILVLGIGNDILTDDGIGPRLIRDLSGMVRNPDFMFEPASCGGLEIMEHIRGYKKVIFIDAIRTREGKPGDVYYFTLSDFKETSHLSSLHDINFLTSLKLADTLRLDLTSDLHIIAVEIVEDLEFSEEFTPALRERYPVTLQEISELIKQISGI